MEEVRFNRMNEHPGEQKNFMQLFTCLLESPRYKGKLSNNAVVAYTVLFNRHLLSLKNKERFTDEEGNVFCLFAQDKFCLAINVKVKTARECMKKLEEIGLIKIVRQGLNRPNRIYVGLPDDVADNLGPVKFTLPERSKRDSSYIDSRNIESLKAITPPDSGGRFTPLDESIDMTVNLYGEVYEKWIGKKHPRLKNEQLDTVIGHIDRVLEWRGVDYTQAEELMNTYFIEYVETGKHDGNINAFARVFDRLYLESIGD